MRTQWFARAAFALSLTLVAAGCGNSTSNESENGNTTDANAAGETIARPNFEAGTTMARLQQAGKMKVGVKYDQAGFGFKNPTTGAIEGFDVEVAKLIAQGIYGGTKDSVAANIEFVEAVSKNREPFIQNGTVDMVVATYTINNARKQVIDFAGPYYVAHGDIMVKTPNDTIKTVTDLNGKNVCTARGSTYPATLRSKAPQSNITELDTYTQCTEALRDGRVEAVTTDNLILAGIVQQNGRDFKLVGTNYTDEPYGIGVKKGDDAFRAYINNRLQETYDKGSWRVAYENTVGKLGLPTPPPPAIDRYTAAGGDTTTQPTGAGSSSTTAAPRP